jgi:hypothetical protein
MSAAEHSTKVNMRVHFLGTTSVLNNGWSCPSIALRCWTLAASTTTPQSRVGTRWAAQVRSLDGGLNTKGKDFGERR